MKLASLAKPPNLAGAMTKTSKISDFCSYDLQLFVSCFLVGEVIHGFRPSGQI